MAKLEYLNTFFTERLLAVAGELYQVVTDIINEYQEETDRTKQENMYLKKLLTEQQQRVANGGDGSTNQVIHEELPNVSDGPLDSNSSLIQVKVELSSMKQDMMTPQQITDSSTMTSPYDFSGNTTNDDYLINMSEVKVKSESMDSQIVISDDSNPGMQSESMTDYNVSGLRDDQGPDTSSHDRVQCEAADRMVYCHCCGKSFRNNDLLKRHMVIHQKDRPRPFRCDLCGKCFSYTQVLEIHRRTHTGERPYRCTFCGRCFNQKGHLKQHERIHTGEKPFGCPVCGKRFIQAIQIRKHISYHHPGVQI